MSSGDTSPKETEFSPSDEMAVAALRGDAAAFAEAYFRSVYGVSMSGDSLCVRRSLGLGYVLADEEPIGRYPLAQDLWHTVMCQQPIFRERDRLLIETEASKGNELARLGDNPGSAEIRVQRNMVHFLVDVAFRLGKMFGGEQDFVPFDLEALTRDGEPVFEDHLGAMYED